MSAGMADIIAAHREHEVKMDHESYLSVCTGCHWRKRHAGESGHAAHVADELKKAGYGNVPTAQAEALTDAADWLLNGEAAGIIAYDGPSNRGEVMAAYDAALEDPEGWLRERAEAVRGVDPADLYSELWEAMADAWDEGRAAGTQAVRVANPYRDEATP